MKTYREKSDRDSFSIPSAWTSAPTLPAPTHASLLMQQVEALEAAKRRAAASYTRMVAHPMPQDMAQTTRDEQEVLCARVAVLNALLEQTAEHSPLCLEATGRERPRVCVTYDRLRCDGELELGPMQSTMAWVVRDAEDPVTQLMSCPDDHPPASVVNGLLDLIRKSAPKKDILQGLHSALTLPPPERLVLKSLRGVNAPEHDGHARVYEGLGESASGPVPPLYRVIWGALDLHVLEGWQNPSTNAAIRQMPLDKFDTTLRAGLKLGKSLGADFVLMNLQYVPAVVAAPDKEAYENIMASAARDFSAGLFRRYDIMRSWYDDGMPYAQFVQLDGLHLNDFGQKCIGRLLTRSIVSALTGP